MKPERADTINVKTELSAVIVLVKICIFWTMNIIKRNDTDSITEGKRLNMSW